MSHLDYLNKNEWKKLGIVSLSAYICSLFAIFLASLIYSIPRTWFITAPITYAITYSVISFFFLYSKGEKIFQKLVKINLYLPIILLAGLVFLIVVIAIFGPHG